MSYYDDDGYVGYDPYEAHDRRVHEERYHKSKVPTTEELARHIYYQGLIDESKKYAKEPEYDGDDFFEAYMTGFEKVLYDAWGDPKKTLELMAKDTVENKDQPRLIATTKEHIIREGTETWIIYKITPEGFKVLGVFYDEEYAEEFIKHLKKMIV